MKHQRIAITGAAGVVASVLTPALRHPVVGVDISSQPAGLKVERWVQGSVADEGLMRPAIAGCTAVIHLATGAPDWPGLQEVDMFGLRVLAEAALHSEVTKLIYASSNHVVGMHERQALAAGHHRQYHPAEPVRPDSPYGVAKAFGEAYCRYISEFTTLRTSCLRIGTVRSVDDIGLCAQEPAFSYIPGGVRAIQSRLRKTWLYHRDLIALIAEELEATDRFRLRFGVSNNSDPFWSREVVVWNG